jgi:cytochrome c553
MRTCGGAHPAPPPHDRMVQLHRSLVVAALAAVVLGPSTLSAAAQSVQEKAEPCLACHGEGGNSRLENVPSLAGQPRQYLLIQLMLFRDKQRVLETMTPFAEKLSDEDIQDLAGYFAERKLTPDPEATPADAARMAEGQRLAEVHHCAQCHLPSFAGREQMARLAGQREDYLLKALGDFRAGARPGLDGTMAEAVYNLSEAELKVLAHLLAHQRLD